MRRPREEKYQLILDSATEAFAEYGYFSCQISKIAKLAGIADGTIYLYFKNKEDILISLFSVRMGQFVQGIRPEILDCQTTQQRLTTIVRAHLRYMQENRSLAIVAQLELRQSDPFIREAISGHLKEYFELIEEVLAQGIETEEIVCRDLKVGRQLLFGALDAVINEWVFSKQLSPLDGVEDTVLELIYGAFRIKT